MAEPLQADVQFKRLNPNQAQAAMRYAEIRNSRIRNITITIPLATEKDGYLQARIPSAAVKDLVDKASMLPQDQRSPFITSWILKNQEAMLSKYYYGLKTRFKLDVVPVQVAKITPSRIPAPRPQTAQPVRPPQQAQPQQVQPPVAAKPTRPPPQAQPPVAAAPARPPKVTQMPPFIVKAPPPQTQTPTVATPKPAPLPSMPAPAAPKIEELPPSGPPKIKITRRIIPPLPSQVISGDGSSARPYVVLPREGRKRGSGIGASEIKIPYTFSLEDFGNIHMKVTFTLSQLAKSSQNATRTELIRIFQGCVDRIAAEKRIEPDRTAVRGAITNISAAFARTIRVLMAQNPDTVEYIDNN